MNVELVSLDFHAASVGISLARFPTVIGYGREADLRLDDLSVSNRHCQLDEREDTLIVRDLGSMHGTFVNGHRVTESVVLPGDELAVGMLSFLVRYLEASPRDRRQVLVGQAGGRA